MLAFLFLAMTMGAAATNDLQQGLVALRDGKLAEARTDFETVLRTEPHNAFAWVSLAETCRRLGDAAAANDAAAKAEKFGGEAAVVDHALASFYAETGQFAHAAAMEEKYAAGRTADAKADLRTAELYERAGDEANAERVLKAADRKRAGDSEVAFAYVQVLLKRRAFDEAAPILAPALAAHPGDPQLVLAKGVIQYGQKKFAEAIDSFLQVTSIDASIPQPYVFLGKMLDAAANRMPNITAVLEARVKAAPEDAAASLVLAKVKMLSDNKDGAAEALLRHVIAINGADWEAHFQLGVLLENTRRFREAQVELERSAQLDAKQPLPHYHLARVYRQLGDAQRAQAELKLHEELSNGSQ